MAYRPTIGLEVHAELKTQTKMFCACKNDPNEARPNVNVCPVCMAHPGTLPVINKAAVEHMLRIGTAVGGTLADFSEFDRKSYFYPDIPKGYQISQYQYPLVVGGSLAGVALTRVHLEEDTARSMHGAGKTLVDFNRAGIPLMELVTEPVIHDAETAGRFARELQLLLRTLGAGDANLEKGEMRVEANISVSADDTYGTKVEIKNLNSFRSVERAIAYEIERQSALIAAGGVVEQATRGWNEGTGETFHQRRKEGSADYRYFPEPDLPKLALSSIPEYAPERIKASLPELPWDKRARLMSEGASPEAAELFLTDPLYEAVYRAQDFSPYTDARVRTSVISVLTSDVRGRSPSQEQLMRLTRDSVLARTMNLFVSGKVSSTSAKEILGIVLEAGGEPEAIAADRGLLQVQDASALGVIVSEIIGEQAAAVDEYRAGKEAALQYLIGMCMKKSKGSGNPALFKELLTQSLA